MSPMVVSVEYSRSRPLVLGASLLVSYSGTSSLGLDPGLKVEDSESVELLRSDAISTFLQNSLVVYGGKRERHGALPVTSKDVVTVSSRFADGLVDD